MTTSSFQEIQEQPLTDGVEAGITDGLASIESGVVNEDTEEQRKQLELERLERRLRQRVAERDREQRERLERERERLERRLRELEPPGLREQLQWSERRAWKLERAAAGLVDRVRRKVDLEWIFVTANFILELPSAVFDQLSSKRKPQFVLLSMLMSFAALFICIIELVYKCGKEKVTWKWKGTLPWLYYPSQSHKPFGSFKDIIGLVCAICQCVVATIIYNFCLQHADNPIKISVWPIIFAFGLLCSKFLGDRERGSTNLPLRRADTL